MIDKKLLSILVCPVTKGELVLISSGDELYSRSAGLAYPVRDGIPVLLATEARQVSLDEKDRLLKRA
jgi:uncharacterized protein YbaR (Trm112 family)